MSSLPIEDIRVIATRVAKRYGRRCWWAEVDEMVQEASVAIIQALRTFDPEVGVPVEGYCHRAAIFAVKHYLWRMSAPVSETHHKRHTLAGVHRASLEQALDIESDSDHEHRQWRRNVIEELVKLANRTENGDLAAAILLEHEAAPSDPAVKKAVRILRRHARTSYPLYRLWKEKL